jgi:2',3'-cyclic-nucleotide 2'-phosphodiesterase (5'-nucleotidase family)
MALPTADPRVFKADADAVTASIIRITLDDEGRPVVARSFRRLDSRIAKDPVTEERVQLWVDLHDTAFCRTHRLPEGCLADPLGRTRTQLEAEELKIRSRETALGNWLADQMRAAFARADVAVINGGTLRLNYDLPAGSILRRR